jgi:DNA polymerase-3 subunit epsilon
MLKFAFIDLETTGTDPKLNGITQIAGIMCSYEKTQGFSIGEEFNFLVRPFEKDEVNAKALEIQGRTMEEIKTYSPPQEVYVAMKGIFSHSVDKFNRSDKMFFAGYNAQFDMNFLREFFVKCNDTYFGSYFFFPPIDVMLLAAVDTMEIRTTLPDFKLGTVAKHYELKSAGTLHDALADIKLTMSLFKFLITKTR